MMKGQETKQRILNEALGAFSLHGYEGARVDKIAEAAGINKASLYFHFKGKRELFLELLTTIIGRYESFVQRIVSSCKGSNLQEQLLDFCGNYLDDSLGNPEIDFWNRIYYLPPAEMKQDVLNLTKNDKKMLVGAISGLIEQAIARGEIPDTDSNKAATSLYYPLTCIALSKDIMSRREAMHDMQICLDHFFRGLRP